MKKSITILSLLFSVSILYSQWQAITPSPSLNVGDIHETFFLDANTGFAAGEGSGKGIILKTTNGGNNWSIIYSTVSNDQWIYSIQFKDNLTGFACGVNGIILSTTNAGNNWSSQTMHNCKYLYCIRFTNSLTGLTCGDGDSTNRGPVYRTTNGGLIWDKVQNSVAHMYKIFFYDANVVYASGDYVIYKSTNSGITWTDIYPGNRNCNDIFFLNENTGFVCGNYSMLKTTNAGANWTEFLISPSDTNYHSSVYFTDNNTGYIPIINLNILYGRIFKTTNSGTTWLLQQTLSGYAESIYFINQNTGFACGFGEKVWKTTNAGGPIGIQPISTEIPSTFSLSQNYPNPFNPVTNIRFEMPRSENVIIKVYDMLGKEITTLVNLQLQPGTYETDWDASMYSSGIFYYKIIAGDYTETKKMVLVK